jgi:hypothetical protein
MENPDSLFMEMFDATSVADSVGEVPSSKVVPPVAVLDDVTHDFRKSDGAADDLCKQLESDALTAELIGPVFDLSGEILSPSAQSLVDESARLAALPDLTNLIKDTARSAELDKSEPRRKREISEIVHSTLGQYIADHHPNRISDPISKADIDECFDRITNSAAQFVRGALMEEAA